MNRRLDTYVGPPLGDLTARIATFPLLPHAYVDVGGDSCTWVTTTLLFLSAFCPAFSGQKRTACGVVRSYPSRHWRHQKLESGIGKGKGDKNWKGYNVEVKLYKLSGHRPSSRRRQRIELRVLEQHLQSPPFFPNDVFLLNICCFLACAYCVLTSVLY